MNSLKNISIDIEHIKDCLENTNELHQTIGVLKDTVVHLVRQNNWLCESVKAMKKDLRTLKDNQTPSQTVGKQKNSNVKKKGEYCFTFFFFYLFTTKFQRFPN